MLKVAIVGCGKIADAHVAQIQRIRGCEIVAACDREELMAKQLCDRFPSSTTSPTAADAAGSRPNVVHITTPPGRHFALAEQCLQYGANVYVEKPFVVNTQEAQEFIEITEGKGIKLTAGHNDQFSHAARRLREQVEGGYLGENAVHIESYYGYDGADQVTPGRAGRQATLGSQAAGQVTPERNQSWYCTNRGVPDTEIPGNRLWFCKPVLKSMGEDEIIDEFRVIIPEDERTTAYFTFSSQMRPSLHELRIYGFEKWSDSRPEPRDLDEAPGDKYKSYPNIFSAGADGQAASEQFESTTQDMNFSRMISTWNRA